MALELVAARHRLTSAAAATVTTLALLVACTGGSGEPGQSSGTSPAPSASAVTTTPAPPLNTSAAPPTSPTVFPASLLGQDLTLIPTTEQLVALTFDAGANSAGLPSILATLADQQVLATFFLTGSWAAANPGGVDAIRAAGHRIGNHSMSHPYFTQLSAAQISDEITGAEQAIQAGGGEPRPLFRFPYGDRDARTIAAVNELGYLPVRWTVDTLGWMGTTGGRSAQQVSDRVVGALAPGAIVLMHVGSNPDDGTTLDADALPDMIDRMRAAGYAFVTLDTLLRK